MVWNWIRVGHPVTSCVSLFHSEMVLGKKFDERVLLAISTRRKYGECVRVSVGTRELSYEQAGEVSRMELQEGHE